PTHFQQQSFFRISELKHLMTRSPKRLATRLQTLRRINHHNLSLSPTKAPKPPPTHRHTFFPPPRRSRGHDRPGWPGGGDRGFWCWFCVLAFVGDGEFADSVWSCDVESDADACS